MTVWIVCAKALTEKVPAIRCHLWPGDYARCADETVYCPPTHEIDVWFCSYCGARVKVVT